MNNSSNNNINILEISTNLSTRMGYKGLLQEYPKAIIENETRSSLLISLAIVIGITVLLVCICLIIRSQPTLKHIRYKRLKYPLISGNVIKGNLDCAVAESTDCNDDCFDENDDDPTEGLLKGKLQIDNNYGNYQTTKIVNSDLRNTSVVGVL